MRRYTMRLLVLLLFLPNILHIYFNGLFFPIYILILGFFLRWFAKRFLHPDIVSIYDYIFLWDEDLGVEHFSPSRYD